MCGRYALFSSGEILTRRFGLDAEPHVQPSYNVAPGARVPAIAWSKEAQPRLLAPAMLWGFPLNAEDRLINARAETADRKPAFREAWRARRCAVPFDAFYEWDKRKKPREPWCFLPRDGPLAFAGLYWPLPDPDTGSRFGCAILTVAPNDEVARVHHRMPLILQPDQVAPFTDPAASPDDLRDLGRTPPDDLLEARRAPHEIAGTDVDSRRLLGTPAHYGD